jgi:hypothetical protein
MFFSSVRNILFAVIIILFCGFFSIAAAATIYFGEDINHTSTPGIENATRISHPNSDQAFASFLGQLQGVATEDFEGFAPNTTLTSLTFGSDTAILSSGLTVLNIPAGTMNGVYPISGNQVLLQSAGGVDIFSISFNTAQAAFGFYATDIEESNNLLLRFLLSDGITTIDRPVPTQTQVGSNDTGSVAYYGVIDTENPFIGVSFIRTINAADGFGFDDMTIGRVENVSTPIPSTIFLLSSVLPFAFWFSGRFKFFNTHKKNLNL